MTSRQVLIHRLLRGGPLPSGQLVESLGISQSSLSRDISLLGESIVRIGAGRSTQYALRKAGHESVLVFRVDEDGLVSPIGKLTPVHPDGFVMTSETGRGVFSDSLPWWMYDMRPQGYLGRAYASSYANELLLSSDPREWSDYDVIKALVAHGQDAVGNLLIGDRARTQFIEEPDVTPVDRASAYPRLAIEAGTGESPGSSAGGEQPKFCTYTDNGHVIVKFTVQEENPISERWRDLLLAEHIALDVLGVRTQVFDFGNQRFLEIPRFDRFGQRGRIGVFSLEALNNEFVGARPEVNWPSLVKKLSDLHVVTPESVDKAALLWAYSKLIGNSDTHRGNLSFVSSQGRPYQLSRPYDILPMAFSPRTSGVISNELSPAVVNTEVTAETWREALELARGFERRVREATGFSDRFSPCIAALTQHIIEAARQIERLG